MTLQYDVLADACLDRTLATYEIKDAHWFHADDADPSQEYCRPCWEAKAAEIKATRTGDEAAEIRPDGCRMEHDHLIYCATCSCPLDGSFTDYGVRSELDHFEEYGFDVRDPSDCHALREMLLGCYWKGGEHSTRLRRLAFKAIRQTMERAS